MDPEAQCTSRQDRPLAVPSGHSSAWDAIRPPNLPSLSSTASPPGCLATLLYALFSFFWFLPVRPADVACWTTPDGAWVSKNIAAFFLSSTPIAPRAGGHQSDCVPSLPAYSGSECLTRAVAIGSLLRVASLLRALLSSPVKWESRILRAETHLTACGAEGDVGRGPGGHLGQRAARPPFGDLL